MQACFVFPRSLGPQQNPGAAQPSLLGRQRVRLEAFKSWDAQIMREKEKKTKRQQMAACVRRSQYQGRAALQTSVTDLMDEVSHTHLQYENDHLHQTHMGRAQWVAFIKHCFSGFPGHPLFVRVLRSTLALWHLFSMLRSFLFIKATLNRPLESSTCFIGKPQSELSHYQSHFIGKKSHL